MLLVVSLSYSSSLSVLSALHRSISFLVSHAVSVQVNNNIHNLRGLFLISFYSSKVKTERRAFLQSDRLHEKHFMSTFFGLGYKSSNHLYSEKDLCSFVLNK